MCFGRRINIAKGGTAYDHYGTRKQDHEIWG